MNLVCDGHDDCGDNSDEVGCHQQANNDTTCQNVGCSHDCIDTVHGAAVCLCPAGMAVTAANTKRCIDIDECAQWGNTCPQICINADADAGYSCACQTGFLDVHGNGSYCRPSTNRDAELYIVSETSTIQAFKVGERVSTDVATAQQKVHAIDIDLVARIIYWMDTSRSQSRLRRALMDVEDDSTIGIPQDLLVQNLVRAEGIAFDWVTRSIYFTDYGRSTVSVALQDGRYTKTLIREVNMNPADIVVSPDMGVMFWIDQNEVNPNIRSAWMTGDNMKKIVQQRLVLPSGITIDRYMGNRIYWTDSKHNTIESCKPDGSDRVIVKTIDGPKPYHLDVYGNYLYYVSQESQSLSRIDKFGRGVPTVLLDHLIHPYDFKVFHAQRYNTSLTNPCASLTCNRLCLLSPNGGQCACPDGVNATNPATCSGPAQEPLTLPTRCHCQNDGVCFTTETDVICNCKPGYHGKHCEFRDGGQISHPHTSPTKPPTTDKSTKAPDAKATKSNSSNNLTAVVIPIVILVILLLVAIGVIFWLYRRGSLSRSKSGHGEVRVGTPGTDGQPNGSTMPADAVQYSVDGQEIATRFSNPIYDKVNEPTYATIGRGNNNVVSLDQQAPPLPSKEDV